MFVFCKVTQKSGYKITGWNQEARTLPGTRLPVGSRRYVCRPLPVFYVEDTGNRYESLFRCLWLVVSTPPLSGVGVVRQSQEPFDLFDVFLVVIHLFPLSTDVISIAPRREICNYSLEARKKVDTQLDEKIPA